MGVLKQYLITVLLVLVIADLASSRYYRWFRWNRFARDLRRCKKPSILEKLCPDIPAVDQCANVDCSCNGDCNSEDGTCNCFPGFSGVNCEDQDVCTIPDFCNNDGTCSNNACQCAENFSGEMCETCTSFSTSNIFTFDRTVYQLIPSFTPNDESCDSFCNGLDGCTAAVFSRDNCEFYTSPVIAVSTLAPNPLSAECIDLCINSEECTLAFLETGLACYLFNTTRDQLTFEGQDFGNLFEEQCN